MVDKLDVENGVSSDQATDHSPPKDLGFLPVPTRLRYDPDKPFHFGTFMKVAFGFASTFSEFYIYPLAVTADSWVVMQL